MANVTPVIADVATPSDVYKKQSKLWELPRTLIAGTKQMRIAGERYLPKDEAETPKAYENRCRRSTLFNAFRKTVADMTGKVFQKPVVLGNDVPDQLKAFAENIDLTGRHLNTFARDCFYDALQVGGGYILTDMPPAVVKDDGSAPTLADEKNAGLRPYLVFYPVESIIGWQSTLVNGVETLTQVRIKENPYEADGLYNEKPVEQIRVLRPGAWETWRKGTTPETSSKWFLQDAGTTSVKKITLTPIYLARSGFMTFNVPLEDLADLNVAHWQSSSDQKNLLHVARVPILFGAGFSSDDTVVIGANTLVRNNSPEAKLTYVEHDGAAIGSGQTDIDQIQFQMQTQGLQLLVPNPGQTATGEIRDDAKENSPLAMMANALADALEISFGFMAEYLGIPPKTANDDAGGQAANDTGVDNVGGSIKVNTDFGVSIGAGDLQLLLNAVNSGKISKQTFWTELKRRDVLSDDFDPVKEAELLDVEPPELGGGNTPAMNLSGSNQPGVTADGEPADNGAVA